jgi:3-methyladenine DNA glycosylase/8-oxoguanine DNA glycosylase
MKSRETILLLSSPNDLALTVASHGWAHLAPWHWDLAAGRLGRRERIEGRLGVIQITQPDLGSVVLCWDGFCASNEPQIRVRVRRWLSDDWQPSPAIAALGDDAALIRRGGGRLLRGSCFYEDFVKTVLTINTSWSATCRMAAALVDEPGGGSFPGPAEMLDYGEERLRERARLGFRAATVVSATRRLIEDGAIDASGEGRPERLTHDYLISLKGIGPYAAAHCRLLLHDFSRIPVDSGVIAYLRQQHDCDPTAFAASRSAWGPYLALGYKLARLREKLELAADLHTASVSKSARAPTVMGLNGARGR